MRLSLEPCRVDVGGPSGETGAGSNPASRTCPGDRLDWKSCRKKRLEAAFWQASWEIQR
jgi:hypothetical protein